MLNTYRRKLEKGAAKPVAPSRAFGTAERAVQSGDAKLSRQHVRATKIVVSAIAAHAVVLVQVVVLIGARAVLPEGAGNDFVLRSSTPFPAFGSFGPKVQ